MFGWSSLHYETQTRVWGEFIRITEDRAVTKTVYEVFKNLISRMALRIRHECQTANCKHFAMTPNPNNEQREPGIYVYWKPFYIEDEPDKSRPEWKLETGWELHCGVNGLPEPEEYTGDGTAGSPIRFAALQI